jgi:thiol-disulfide isomerase/thioredoxin
MDYKSKYLKYKQKYLKKKLELTGGANQQNTLYLFKAEWCGHCVAFKEHWNTLTNDHELKNKINFVKYDSNEHGSKMTEFNISGFPTLILKNGDQQIEYTGSRNVADIKEFIKIYNV